MISDDTGSNVMELLMFASSGVSSWALMNLVMSIAGIIFVAIAVIYLLTHKRKEDEKENNRKDSFFEEVFEYPKNDEFSGMFSITWFTVGAVAAFAAVILFILTQDLSANVALADLWTTTHAIILAIVILCCAVVFIGHRTKPRD
jgi:Na+/melibiose symporter-like transporter